MVALLACLLLAAADVSIDAPDTVRAGESFRIRISARGSSVSGIDLEPPSAGGVSFGGRSSSTSIRTSMVNGRRTTERRAEVVLSYTAFRPGTLRLGPFRVSTGGGGSHDLGPVDMVVLADSTEVTAVPGRRRGGSARPIWLEAVPEMPRRLYAGMPLRVRYVLHTRYPLRRITRSWQSPEHAVARLAEDPGDPVWESEDGLFSRAEILTLEMIPACPGSVLVPFVEVSAVAFARGSPLGSSVTLQSDSQRVAVHPVPREGRPANFCGALGELSLTLEVAPDSNGVSEREVTLTADGAGAAYIEDCPPITVEGPAELEEVARSGAGKRRTWTLLLVPEDSGRVVLGPDSLAWMDPGAGSFHQAVFGPVTLRVSAPGETAGEVVRSPDRSRGPSAVWVAAGLVALVAAAAAALVLRTRRRPGGGSLEEARDPDELMSALESSLSRQLTGREGYVDGRELDRMLSLRGVDRITARSVVACWRHAEALVSGSERYMLEDVREEAMRVLRRLEGLLAAEGSSGRGRGKGS